MHSILLLILGFAFANLPLYSQSKNVFDLDSVRLELSKGPDDTTRINLYHLLSDQLRGSNSEQSRVFLDSAFMVLMGIDWPKGAGNQYFYEGRYHGLLAQYKQAIVAFDSAIFYYHKAFMPYKVIKSSILLGICYQRTHDYTKAYRVFQDALSLVDKKKYPEDFIELNESIASIYDKMGSPQKAIAIYRENESLAMSQNLIKQAMISKGNLGQALAGIGQFDEGLLQLFETFEYFKEHNLTSQELITLINIAFVYGSLENYEEALVYLLKAQDICRNTNSKYEEVMVRKNLSQVYMKLNDKDNAFLELEGVLNDYIEMGDSVGLAKTHQLLGNFFLQEQQYNEAIEEYLLAQEIGERFGNLEFTLSIKSSLALVYFKNNALKMSDSYLDQALELAFSLNMLHDIAKIYSYKSRIAEKRSNFKEALHYLKEHFRYEDSINLQKQLSEIEKMNFAFEVAAKNEEIMRLEADSALKQLNIVQKDLKYRYSLGLFVLIFFLFIVFIFFFYYKKKVQFRTQKAELNLKVLRSQMNPHFIFNALTSIHGFVMSNQGQVASDYLIKFSKLMRKVLQNSYQDFISLEEEVKMLSLYLQLESCRLNHKFTYKIEVDPNLNSGELLIPPLLIQPFVENSVWHGLANIENKGHITISFQSHGETLFCVVEDNGVGRSYARQFQAQSVSSHRSLGVSITRERLKMLAHKERKSWGIQFEDLTPGLRVSLSIPVTMKF